MIEKLPITERVFPYWSMGFEKLEAKELAGIEGFNNFGEEDLTPAGLASHKHSIEPLLAYLHHKLVKQVASANSEHLPMQVVQQEKALYRFITPCIYNTKSCVDSYGMDRTHR